MTLITELTETIGLSPSEIMHIIATAPARYKVYPIKKRNGGERIIAQPSRELKIIQRYILDRKLRNFKTHSSAMAYEEGRSISDNAQLHRLSDVILKLDFRNFFPSIRVKDWTKLLEKNPVKEIPEADYSLYSKILFWGQLPKTSIPRCLSIGAPTSPRISNILMYDFDVFFFDLAKKEGLVYTRYADDITVSGASIAGTVNFERQISKYVRSMKSPRLQLNEEKRGLFTKSQRRMVTGLILTPDQKVSIGRDRKRKISSLVHRSTLGQLDLNDRGLLKGLLGFCISAEPHFMVRLREKYGNDAVDEALRFHVPSRRITRGDG